MDIAAILAKYSAYIEQGANVASVFVPGIAPEVAAADFLLEAVRKAALAHIEITGKPMDPTLLKHIDEVPE